MGCVMEAAVTGLADGPGVKSRRKWGSRITSDSSLI